MSDSVANKGAKPKMNTLAKSVVHGRLMNIGNILGQFAGNKKASKEELQTNIANAVVATTSLMAEIDKDVKEGDSPLFHLDQKTFDTTMKMFREKIRTQYVGFPMAAALIEAVLMALESDLRFNVHFLAIQHQAITQDRMSDHNRFYKTDGEPKNP